MKPKRKAAQQSLQIIEAIAGKRLKRGNEMSYEKPKRFVVKPKRFLLQQSIQPRDSLLKQQLEDDILVVDINEKTHQVGGMSLLRGMH